MTEEYIEMKIKLYDENCKECSKRNDLKYMFYLGKRDAWVDMLSHFQETNSWEASSQCSNTQDDVVK